MDECRSGTLQECPDGQTVDGWVWWAEWRWRIADLKDLVAAMGWEGIVVMVAAECESFRLALDDHLVSGEDYVGPKRVSPHREARWIVQMDRQMSYSVRLCYPGNLFLCNVRGMWVLFLDFCTSGDM